MFPTKSSAFFWGRFRGETQQAPTGAASCVPRMVLFSTCLACGQLSIWFYDLWQFHAAFRACKTQSKVTFVFTLLLFGFLGFLLSFAEHRRNVSQGDSKSGQAVPHFERSLPTLEGHEFCAPVMLAPQLHVGLLGKLQDWARACLLASGFWVAACLFKGLAHRIHL